MHLSPVKASQQKGNVTRNETMCGCFLRVGGEGGGRSAVFGLYFCGCTICRELPMEMTGMHYPWRMYCSQQASLPSRMHRAKSCLA